MKPILPLLISSLARRETPQELSHDRYITQVKQMLDLNNTIHVSDPTYGLLVNSMAATGRGSVIDTDCLQLTIADIAFTNAKATNNLDGLVASLIYRALERNTPEVGAASEPCTSYTPSNPELATFKQHQDPASPGAQANNKAVVLELARQIALIGGEPTDALNSGTFRPGDLGSTNAAGNACNTPDCIFDDDNLIRDASQSEVYEYVEKCVETVTSIIGGGTIPSSAATYHVATVSLPGGSVITSTQALPTSTSSTQGGSQASYSSQSNSSQGQPTRTSTTTASQATSTNLQTFTAAYLGISAPAVYGPDSNGYFHVDTDQSSFNTVLNALARSCNIQKNNCANEANKEGVAVSGCDSQLTDCKNQTGSNNA